MKTSNAKQKLRKALKKRKRNTCRVVHGDSTLVMSRFSENVFDSIITDPPYGFFFMGKKWDYSIPSVQAFHEMLRVAKPGATLLCFAGPRTQHRMAVNIEDAGWRLWDTILWVFGSGFPKAASIPKQIDLEIGAVWIVEDSEGERLYEWQIDGKIFHDKAAPDAVSDQAKFWLGQKSCALKPAYEPIICAMKPNEGTYAQNALKHGVSGLAIDRGRIVTDELLGRMCTAQNPTSYSLHSKREYFDNSTGKGRFPANLILGCACESPPPHEPGCACAMLDEQSGERPGKIGMTKNDGVSDFGGSSRYFKQIPPDAECRMRYVAKASRRERGENNNHPTCKPLKLIRYLCRLTKTPTGGLVLDPFAGSGTTGLAALMEGRDCILIEREKQYIDIIKQRLKGATSNGRKR